MHIPLHKPLWGKPAEQAIVRTMRAGAGVADGSESILMRVKLGKLTGVRFAIPVTSCTHAMEAAVAVLGANTGDEVIVPSFTLAATATAVMIRGARPVFADIDPITFSLDPADVEKKITKKTVGIITVHYAGFAGPHFDALVAVAKAHNLWLVEDAAHGIGSFYKGKHLGTFGAAGALSFHGTKNVAAGEGGAILTNKTILAERMEIFRSIGTDRMRFLQGKVSAYRWVGEGSSYMLSDLLASLINIQLDHIDRINKDRKHIASEYTKLFKSLKHPVYVPVIPNGMTKPNWHIYAIRFEKKSTRDTFVRKMREKRIDVTTHYVPLHSSPMGRKLVGRVALPVTDMVAETMVRLPIYAGMTERELEYVISTTRKVFKTL